MMARPRRKKLKRAVRRRAVPKKKKKAALRKQRVPRRKVKAKKAPLRKKRAPKRTVKAKRKVKRVVVKKETAGRKKKPAVRKKTAGPEMPRPAFPQRAGASPKQLFLFELMRARATLLSALQGLASGTSDPIAPGKWSPREIVLHIVTRDQARLREWETTLRGTPHSWRTAQEHDWARINEENLAPLRHHDWDEALRLLNRTRQQLIEELESVPEEPSERWSEQHAFGAMLVGLPPHDRHHADQIKRWRASRGA